MVPSTTDVLIVGAGPTGLSLAVALRQAGIRHVLIDERSRPPDSSRAAVVHAHTLEALDAIGVAAALLERGLPLARFSVRDRDRVRLRLRFDAEALGKMSPALLAINGPLRRSVAVAADATAST